eukprot:scaffold34655_cov157-Amphora_coffeaeformis.AAC.5
MSYEGVGNHDDDNDDQQTAVHIQALPVHQDPREVVGAPLFHADFENAGISPSHPEHEKKKQTSDAFAGGIDEPPLVKPSEMRKKKRQLLSDHIATTTSRTKEDEKKDDSVLDDDSLFDMVDVLASIDETEEYADEEAHDMVDAFFDLFAKANEEGWTELATTAMKAWLELEPSLVEVTDGDGDMPLHWACECAADAEAVITLLEALPQAVHVKNHRGWTALHLAVFSGASTEVVLILLEIYPEAASIQDYKNGCTLLHYALLSRAPSDVVKELFDDSDTSSDVLGKARFFREEMKHVPMGAILAILSACPLMAKVTDNKRNTALHLGMIGGAPAPAIKAVLQVYPGAARATNGQGKLPLHCALEHGALVEAVTAVLEKYPDATTVRDKAENMTPLLYGLKHGAPKESILAVLEESPEAARITDRQGRFPFECGVDSRAPIEVMKTLRVAYPEAAIIESSSSSMALHDCFESLRPEEDILYILQVWPEAAKVVSAQGKLPLHLAIEHRVELSVFEAILEAYPEAASISSAVCPSPIDQLTRECAHEDGFDELIRKDVIGFLKLMLTSSIEVKALEKLCKKDNPVALQAFFGLFAEPVESENSDDSSAVPCINLNRETILGGTPLEILADLDTPDSADILLQIVKNQQDLLAAPKQTIVIILSGDEPRLGNPRVSFVSTETVAKTTMLGVARKCMLSSQFMEIQHWGEGYGRLLEKYSIKSGEYPRYISETCVVVFATETRQDQQGQAFEAPVALKFMTDRDSFWREIKLRAEVEAASAFESDQTSLLDNNVARVIEGYTSQLPPDFETERFTSEEQHNQSPEAEKNTRGVKFGRTYVQCGVNLRKALVPFKSIRPSVMNPNTAPDLDYLLVMECGSSLDASDVIFQQDIAAKNIGAILHMARSIARVLYYFNDKCHITHGDTKDRNFICQGARGDYAAIDMDNSVRHGELVGQKRSSSGYIPPEQARVEYYLRKMESQSNYPPGLSTELLEAKEEVDSLKKKVQEAMESDEYAVMDRLVTKLRVAKQRINELQAPPEKPPSVMASNKYDMWSFGCLIFKLCTGRQIFDMDAREHVNDSELRKIMCWDTVALQKKMKSLPSRPEWRGLCEVLERLLQADPTERPSSWLDIVDMLEQIDQNTSVITAKNNRTTEVLDGSNSAENRIDTVLEVARQLLQESDQRSIKALQNSFDILQKEASKMENMFFQLGHMHCPYLFRFIEKQEFRRLAREKGEPENGTKDVRSKFEEILRRGEGLLSPKTDFSGKTQHELAVRANCMEKAWSKVGRKKGEILYLQLLCGWTLEPVASYEVKVSKYLKEIQQLSKVGDKLCAVGIKVSLLWEVEERTAKMFGVPISKIQDDLVEKAVDFLKAVDEKIGNDATVGAIPVELDCFGSFLDELERKGKLCQLLDKVDEDGVRGSWKEALRRIAVGKSGTTQQLITYISARESERLVYSKEDIELAEMEPKEAKEGHAH